MRLHASQVPTLLPPGIGPTTTPQSTVYSLAVVRDGGTTGAVTAVPYSAGQLLDIYSTEVSPAPVVLLWHGRGATRSDLAPLAAESSRRGLLVFVPDWYDDAYDGGRDQLLASLRFTLDRAVGYGGDPRRFVLGGWSAGARAAAGVVVTPSVTDGWRPSAFVGISGHYERPAATTGDSPTDELKRTSVSPVPVWLVHGTVDKVVSPSSSERFAALLRARAWPVQLLQTATDHAGIIMTTYDKPSGQCLPTPDKSVREAGAFTVAAIVAAAGS
jgi:predicted esterase